MTRFYLNHIGLERGPHARVLVDVTEPTDEPIELVTAAGWTVVDTLVPGESLPAFRGRLLAPLDLGHVETGRYVLRQGEERSEPFHVGTNLLFERTIDALLGYFRSQRCREPWDAQDRSIGFVDARTDRVDVHGGWYDASGDLSKYLSHLSYANFMNPQQTPLVVWGLLEHAERLTRAHAPGNRERALDEARHGADFLCRMQDADGYFYATVFDQWSKFPERRVICAFKTQKGELLEGYQAAYRQGGGLAIAALARAARLLGESRYFDVAKKGFLHLEEANARYLPDGRENVIDDYSALLAATELYASSGDALFLHAATKRADSLLARVMESGPTTGWLRADDGERPFHHAADAGLPVVALLRFAEIVPSEGERILAATTKMLRAELALTNEVANPYGYARQYVQDRSGARRTSFFIPHDNETGYWWQGENARLASLAAAASFVARLSSDEALRADLRAYATRQLDWICGQNPFDSCMIHGFGHGNRNYMDLWPNVHGGILNGITSTFEDESDVDFGRTDVEGDQSWRWFEQWLPHATWFLIALTAYHPDAGQSAPRSS